MEASAVQHLLYLVEKIHDTNLECNAYDDYCKLPLTSVELCSTESVMYRCVESYCGFQIHFLWGPLPPTIDTHLFLLAQLLRRILMNIIATFATKKEIQKSVYYCQECKYTAHVH
ncbi:hypothetical protein L484_001157 [Morus notabilis]|uniref:Uncharacterized protein n=1 Tax=Morus notabilis TaxID=981085 RepID=W9R207_9ROSA|nr:hypothetical protein L484_001157 [Morus notabilis]